jgi:hypothetical protein
LIKQFKINGKIQINKNSYKINQIIQKVKLKMKMLSRVNRSIKKLWKKVWNENLKAYYWQIEFNNLKILVKINNLLFKINLIKK